MSFTVAIVGGGISGLAAAHRLQEHAPHVRTLLLESSSRLGGVLQTSRESGYMIEAAADGFLTSPSAAVDLCRRVGLGDALQSPDPQHRRAFVVSRGKLQPIPEGFMVLAPSRLWPLVSSPVLSVRGKLRAASEPWIRRRQGDEDESLQSFVSRRFGGELYERLAQPLVGGIYSADAARLSVEATMPRFRQLERAHGSLLVGMWRERHQQERSGSGARYARFSALTEGMSSLVSALARRLPPENVSPDSPVECVFPLEGDRWLLVIGGSCPRVLSVDGLILATPAHRSARLLHKVDAQVAEDLRQIEHASCAVVSLGYRREQIGHALDGFGFVVPLVEQRLILSCSFASVKYPGRAPAGEVLLRIFIGGACQPQLLQIPGPQLIELAEREVASLLRIRGGPTLQHIVRQPSAMPQYHVGHVRRAERIDSRLQRFPTLALAGNALHGVGVPSCIQSGEVAAQRLASACLRLTSNCLAYAES